MCYIVQNSDNKDKRQCQAMFMPHCQKNNAAHFLCAVLVSILITVLIPSLTYTNCKHILSLATRANEKCLCILGFYTEY